jgi:hypothetical protein
VWKGHVIIILDQERVIESRPGCHGETDGVRLAALQNVLQDILAKRLPVDDHGSIPEHVRKSFVIRRWYDTAAAKGFKFLGASSPGGLHFFVPR